MLEEKRKIARAESYLRKKFRNKVVRFVLSEKEMCAKLDDATSKKLFSLLRGVQPTPSIDAVEQRSSAGESSCHGKKRKQNEAEDKEEQSILAKDEEEQSILRMEHDGTDDDGTDDKSSAANTGKHPCTTR